ncbi:hypothetical protein KDW_30510 [Dictyobacter vulcani]|uniref:Uncharacterized protein n=1 Tax=Dictyobacter vulcani TaxID=2607529 RepID=A0A5J4KS20_9CHLR|nr:hypothetical protein [Dictyobacter vulcani]GER88889.1 hypothetical protein KDW_30510 [Dictyobacter vulcani]
MTYPMWFGVFAIACMLMALVVYRRTDTRSIVTVVVGIVLVSLVVYNWDALNHLTVAAHLFQAFFHATPGK